MAVSPKSRWLIERIFHEFHHPRYLELDPLVWVRKYPSDSEREIAGLVASCLAYGRVQQILKSLDRISSVSGPSLLDFAMGTSLQEKKRVLAPFCHRFNTGEDIAILLEVTKDVLADYTTLGALFGKLYSQRRSLQDALCGFTLHLCTRARALDSGLSSSFGYLLPSASGGSACKRLSMYLRWMVRPDDGIDLGVWGAIPASSLLVPVDTHVANISQQLGLTKRRSPDWIMSTEITASLKKIDPSDPVKYDFSLCRAGMLGFFQEPKNAY